MTDEQQQPHPRHQEYEDLLSENNAEIRRMAQQEGIQINGATIEEQRHAFFVDRLIAAMPSDERYAFEIDFQKQVKATLKRTAQHARRQRLIQGGHIPKGGAPSILHPGSQNGTGRG